MKMTAQSFKDVDPLSWAPCLRRNRLFEVRWACRISGEYSKLELENWLRANTVGRVCICYNIRQEGEVGFDNEDDMMLFWMTFS